MGVPMSDAPPRLNPIRSPHQVNAARAITVAASAALSIYTVPDARGLHAAMIAFAAFSWVAWAIERRSGLPVWFDRIQVLADSVVLTAALFLTDTLDTAFTVFYTPIILISTLRQGRQVGAVALAASLASYGVASALHDFGWAPPITVPLPAEHAPLAGFLGVFVSFGVTWVFLVRAVEELSRNARASEARLEAERAARVAEEALQARRAEVQRMESLGRLAGGVAHDFNNLLTVIVGSVHMIEEETHDERVRDDLRVIRDHAERATALTRQLITLGKGDPFRAQPLSIDALIRDVKPSLDRLVGNAVTIEITGSCGPAIVLGDPRLLEQALVNLVINAREAMPHGGRLEVALSTRDRVVTGQLVEQRGVEVLVRDTGVGIPPDDLPHLFEPFYTPRVESPRAGLGLTTVQEIVRQHRGAVQVTSTLGVGTVFSIWLPAADAQTPRPPEGPNT